jgi:hypothetical protein
VDNRSSSTLFKYKDITYKINKTNARTACWLFTFMSSRAKGIILNALGTLDEPEFNHIQNMALKSVFKIEDQFELPVLGPGNVLVGELNDDPALLLLLTSRFLSFNLEPFMDVSVSDSQTSSDQVTK